MKLPNAHVASVDHRKVVDYLLNAAHPDNGGNVAVVQVPAKFLLSIMRPMSKIQMPHRPKMTEGDVLVFSTWKRITIEQALETTATGLLPIPPIRPVPPKRSS